MNGRREYLLVANRNIFTRVMLCHGLNRIRENLHVIKNTLCVRSIMLT